MMNIVYFEGVKATVQKFKFKFLAIAILALFSFGFGSCGNNPPPVTPDETYATVNGKAIKMQEVDRVVKQQAQGQEAKLSPLELNQARLQVLQNLIQQEVLFQKAEKEKTIPTDEEVTAEFNKLKTASGKSAEELTKEMEKAGETEATFREGLKRQLAISKLVEKITSKVEPPKDSEIEGFFKGNPEAFIKKRGVKLAAIVVDPANSGEGDKTTNEADAVAAGNAIIQQLRGGGDFVAIAREKSEDPSRAQGGELGYITEEQLKQTFQPQLAAILMDPKFPIGQIQPTQVQGKYYILKLQERSEKDETLTLESTGVRQQITDALTKGRKDLVREAYAAQAMNEARIDNLLLKKIIDNPNELSGARPAVSPNANANSNANTSGANTNSNANANQTKANTNSNTKAETKPVANTNTAPKPANAK